MGERVKVFKKIHKSREYIIEENMNDIKSRLSDRKIAIEKGIDILDALEEAGSR
ncbi:hypothetical protein NIT60_08345 [Mammaliicoccus sciuri]|nr:hypothetical protein NIT60_08345 [Mammaliicoccus sciuri]